MDKKQRKRVPVSCLVCKKRKVRCDKGRPACGGCVRNGVSHLCLYVEPHWSDGLDQDKVIAAQRDEIDRLKRELAMRGDFTTGVKQRATVPEMDSGIASDPILILSKLRPLSATSRDLFQIGQSNYRLLSVNNKKYSVDKYSWMSIIKLDSKLINLWLKMIKFHQYYLAYKRYLSTHKKKKECPVAGTQSGSCPVSHGNIPKCPIDYNNIPKCPVNDINLVDQCPVSHTRLNNIGSHSQTLPPISTAHDLQALSRINQNYQQTLGPNVPSYKIDSASLPSLNSLKSLHHPHGLDISKCPIDHSAISLSSYLTTSSSGTSSQSLHKTLKCPVLDTSEIIESDNDPSKMASPTPTPIIKNEFTPSSSQPIYEDINTRISKTLMYLKRMWDSMVSLGGNQKLNDKLLHFLMEFYFNNDIIIFDSRNILSFYKSEITGIVLVKNDIVMFDCKNFMTQERDENLLQELIIKGTYLSMLTIIVDESLSYLRHHCKVNPRSVLAGQFKSLFGENLLHHKLPNPNVSLVMKGFAEYFKASTNHTTIGPCLPFIVLLISWIKQQMLHYSSRDYSSIDKSDFTKVVIVLLQLLLNENAMIEIWKNPKSVKFLSNSIKSDVDLAIHLCYLWVELVRLSNLMTFNLIFSLNISETLDSLLRQLYIKIEEADYSQCHLIFLREQNGEGNNYGNLMVYYETHYLISRINSAINHGAMNLGEPKLTIGNLQTLINQGIEQVDKVNNLQQPTKRFESSCILNYLNCYMSHVILLQGEDSNKRGVVSSVIPEYFIRFANFINFLQTKVEKESHSHLSQYILLIITEFLTKSIQMLIGLILRLSGEDNSRPQDNLVSNEMKQLNSITQAPYNGLSLTQLVKEHMVNSVDECLVALRKSSILDQNKVEKLSSRWVDYCTITTKVNYTEIHKHIPELVGKFLPNGPNSVSAKEVSISKLDEFRRCPISHITTAIDDNPETPRIQGVLAHQSLEVKDDRKRSCPFESAPTFKKFESMKNHLNTPNSLTYDDVKQEMPPIQPDLNIDLLPVPAFDFNSLSDLNIDFFQQDGLSLDTNFTYENIFGDAGLEF